MSNLRRHALEFLAGRTGSVRRGELVEALPDGTSEQSVDALLRDLFQCRYITSTGRRWKLTDEGAAAASELARATREEEGAAQEPGHQPGGGGQQDTGADRAAQDPAPTNDAERPRHTADDPEPAPSDDYLVGYLARAHLLASETLAHYVETLGDRTLGVLIEAERDARVRLERHRDGSHEAQG